MYNDSIYDYFLGRLRLKDDTSSFISKSGTSMIDGNIIIANGNHTSDLLTLLGTDNTPDANDIMHNNLFLDGVNDGDHGIWWGFEGNRCWYDYIYRDESGEFKYLWNQTSKRDILTISDSGRMGINKVSNIIFDKSLFNGSGIDDAIIGGKFVGGLIRYYKIVVNSGNTTASQLYSTDNISYISCGPDITIDTSQHDIDSLGATITWLSNVGHQSGDTWFFIAFPQKPIATFTVAPVSTRRVLVVSDFNTPIYTDNSFKSNYNLGTPFILIPTGTTGALYVGDDYKFQSIYVTLVNNNTTYTDNIIEYWNGSNWIQITSSDNLRDETSGLTITGVINLDTVYYMQDWTKSEIENYTGYWLRIRKDGNVLISPIANTIVHHTKKRFSVFGTHLDVNPVFNVNYDGSVEVSNTLTVSGNSVFTSSSKLEDISNVNVVNQYDASILVFSGNSWVQSAYGTYAGFTNYIPPYDNTDGSLTLYSTEVKLYSTINFKGIVNKWTLASGRTGIDFPAIPNNILSYVVADYNNGSPKFDVITDEEAITESNIIPYLTVFREGLNIFVLNWNEQGLGLSNKLHQRFIKTRLFERESGLILGEIITPSARTFTISEGKIWYGSNRVTLDVFNSNINDVDFYYLSGNTWYEIDYEGEYLYNNSQYNSSSGLTGLTDSYFNINWIYRFDSDNTNGVGTFLSTEEYSTIDLAKAVTIPSNIPNHIRYMGILVGRIIVQKSASTAYIQSAFDVALGSTGIINHNDTANIDGGASDEYFHLSLANYDALIAGNVTNIHKHNFSSIADSASTLANYSVSSHTHLFSSITDSATTLSNYYTKTQSNDNFLSANTSFYTQIDSDSRYISKSGTSEIYGNLIPAISGLTLGSSTSPWKAIYLSGLTLYFDNKPLGLNANGQLEFSGLTVVTSINSSLTDLSFYYTSSQTDSLFLNYYTSAYTNQYFSRTGHSHLFSSITDSAITLANYSLTSHTHEQYLLISNFVIYTGITIPTLLLDYSVTSHTHDSRYYTKSQTDTILLDYSTTAHTHDSRYYLKDEVYNTGQTYSKTESDLLFNTKSVFYIHTGSTNPHNTTVNSLSGVNITNVQEGDVLLYSSGNWINSTNAVIASNVSYNSANTFLISENVQEAISELDLYRNQLNSGIYENPTLIDNLDGSLTLNSSITLMYNNELYNGSIKKYEISSNSLTLPLNEISYIYVDYNNGNPQYAYTTNPTLINGSDKIPVLRTINLSNVYNHIHHLSYGDYSKGFINKYSNRILETQAAINVNGLILSENSGRLISIGSGVVWFGVNRLVLTDVITHTAITSATTSEWFHSGGTWKYNYVTSYNNSEYDDGQNKIILSANTYGVIWVYRDLSSDVLNHDIHYILGNNSYDIDGAINALLPTPPDFLQKMGMLVGKIIIQSGASSAYSIVSAFNTSFIGAVITSHNNLSNIDGGIPGQYYHLSSNEYNLLTTSTDASSIHNHNSLYLKLTGGVINGNLTATTFSGNLNWNYLTNTAQTGLDQLHSDSHIHNQINGNIPFGNGLYGMGNSQYLRFDSANTFLGVGLDSSFSPQRGVHVYSLSSATELFKNLTSGFAADGHSSRDKGYDIFDSGNARWTTNYIYQNEDGEFLYTYNYNFDKDIMVMSDTGRIGINNKTNFMTKYSVFNGTGTDDMVVGGLYTITFRKYYEIVIHVGQPTSPNQWKFRSSSDGVVFSSYSTPVNIIPNTYVSVENGITIKFTSGDGHNTGDKWSFVAFPQLPDASLSISSEVIDAVYTATNYNSPILNNITYTANSIETDAFNCLPTGTTGALYVGRKYKFNSIFVNLITQGVGVNMIVEYWNGAWSAATYVDNTSNLTKSGSILLYKYLLSGWTDTILDGSDSLYWLRIRSNTNVTTSPIAKTFSSHGDKRLSIYASPYGVSPQFYIDSLCNISMGVKNIENNNRLSVSGDSKFYGDLTAITLYGNLNWNYITSAPAFITGFTELDPVWNADKSKYYTSAQTNASFLSANTSFYTQAQSNALFYTSAYTNQYFSRTGHTHTFSNITDSASTLGNYFTSSQTIANFLSASTITPSSFYLALNTTGFSFGTASGTYVSAVTLYSASYLEGWYYISWSFTMGHSNTNVLFNGQTTLDGNQLDVTISRVASTSERVTGSGSIIRQLSAGAHRIYINILTANNTTTIYNPYISVFRIA